MTEVRLINAVVLVDIETHRAKYAESPEKADAYRQVLWDIAHCATIDAVPVVHGRWVHEQRYGDSGGWVWRCTACRREAITPIISALKYCHACGAKMDGGAEE